MKITYKEKYDSLVSEFGLEEGIKKYKKFLKSASLEKCIIKYGKEEGEIKYAEIRKNIKESRFTRKKAIEKYGEEEGIKKYENWIEKTKQNLPSFVKRYGEEEGKRRYDIFRKRCAVSEEMKINPNSTYNLRQISTTLTYFLNKGYTEEIAKEKLKNRQNTSSLKVLIKKYGEEEGKRRYIEINKKKELSLNKFIELYGFELGTEKWNKLKDRLKYAHSKQYCLDKYGQELGNLKWNEWTAKKCIRNKYSNVSFLIFEHIVEKIKDKNFKKIYYGENEYSLYLNHNEFNLRIFKPDFYIKDINLIIEYYGDFWHRNPKFYESNEENELIWKKDKRRIELIKKQFNSDVIIIWENDIRENSNLIKEIIKKIIER